MFPTKHVLRGIPVAAAPDVDVDGGGDSSKADFRGNSGLQHEGQVASKVPPRARLAGKIKIVDTRASVAI